MRQRILNGFFSISLPYSLGCWLLYWFMILLFYWLFISISLRRFIVENWNFFIPAPIDFDGTRVSRKANNDVSTCLWIPDWMLRSWMRLLRSSDSVWNSSSLLQLKRKRIWSLHCITPLGGIEPRLTAGTMSKIRPNIHLIFFLLIFEQFAQASSPKSGKTLFTVFL